MKRIKSFQQVKRLVIKIGTSTIIKESGKINYYYLEKLAKIVSDLHAQGREVVIVSSGAIGVGASKFNLQQKPQRLDEKQAMAAIGQGLLMHMYENIFSKYGVTVAQMLLIRSDFEDSIRQCNTRNTFDALFKYKVIPIVNENDTVAVEEIVYGDNDTLSAAVSILIGADILIMLSDTDGLYSGNFRKNKNVKKISFVEDINEEIESFACGVGSSFGTGGMRTKISAAKLATVRGIAVAIIKGKKPEQIMSIIQGKNEGTIFLPKKITEGQNQMESLSLIGKKAKLISSEIAHYSTKKKNDALKCMAESLINAEKFILKENIIDLEIAQHEGKAKVFLDRLMLDKKRIKAMAEGLLTVATLPDPVGEIESRIKRPNGLCIEKRIVPLGVIGIIYEARPNVTVDASALCFKAGNAVILRGGSGAINSNKALVKVLKEGLRKGGIPFEAIQLIENTEKRSAIELMKMRDYIDVLIPRGGASLIKTVVENSLIPVIETGVGNCHIFVDETADLEMAKKIVINAKTSRPAVCNAAETLLIAEGVAPTYLPIILSELEELGVEIRGCDKVKKLFPKYKIATEEDWHTEYLDYIISVKVVKNINEAINHINKYGTKHSEAIVTENQQNAKKFSKEIDAATVYINASTRFTDGFEFGLGAEIGISTQKLHARGPMGLRELTSYKYIIYGNGQIR